MRKQLVRNTIASIYWSLNKHYKQLWEQGDDREVFYDVGLMIG